MAKKFFVRESRIKCYRITQSQFNGTSVDDIVKFLSLKNELKYTSIFKCHKRKPFDGVS